YRSGWIEAPPLAAYRNPYRVGREAFLRHVATDAPPACDFTAGIRDVAFAEACPRSMRQRTSIALPPPAQPPSMRSSSPRGRDAATWSLPALTRQSIPFGTALLRRTMDARVISAFTRVFDALLPAHDPVSE